jgi:hypothetical protein
VTDIIWKPHPGPQTHFIQCPTKEVFYGGARGGGKTDAVLGEWLAHSAPYGEHAIGLVVRRQLVELSEMIARSKMIYHPLQAVYHEAQKEWRMHNGARLRFAYLERDSDADGYQGHSYTRVYVEEIGTFPNRDPINKLMATLRSGHGVPVGFRATGNPGGPGHHHVRSRYIDPAPGGYTPVAEEFTNPFNGQKSTHERIFIPAKVSDNPSLDGSYVTNLQMSGSPELVRAWLEGDWSVIDGAYFDGWNTAKHVLKPFQVPRSWLRFRSMDWGYATPFSVQWWCVVPEDWLATTIVEREVLLPKGALVQYREWYGSVGDANKGLRLDAEEIAGGILERERGEDIAYGVLDPSAFNRTSGPSMAERMADKRVVFRRADNTRVSKRGPISGWDAFRSRLRGIDGLYPMMYVFSTCRHFIRTVPLLQHDRDDPEDLDTTGEDHAADAGRYAVVSRPWLPGRPDATAQEPVQYKISKSGQVISNLSVKEIVEQKVKRRKAR